MQISIAQKTVMEENGIYMYRQHQWEQLNSLAKKKKKEKKNEKEYKTFKVRWMLEIMHAKLASAYDKM